MIEEKIFGRTQNGEEVKAFIMKSGAAKVTVLEFGCAMQSYEIELSNGQTRDIMLGYDSVSGYEKGTSGQGSFIGRHANRIKGASFELGGKTYTLSKNDGENHLHGAFSKKLFKGSIEGNSVVFKGESPDGEDGFPGHVNITVTYTLAADGAFKIDYKAETDADTVINLTNHSYFNLNGQGTSDIYGHTLWLNCKSFCEADAETCPTGNILPVEGTPMDFTSAKPMGSDINSDYVQLKQALGYDHNFIIDKPDRELAIFAMVKSDDGMLLMEGYTTQPGVQFYSANHLNEEGKGGVMYIPRDAFCLETQHYPCSTSYPHFPSVVLKKGDTYSETTIYKVYEVV